MVARASSAFCDGAVGRKRRSATPVAAGNLAASITRPQVRSW